MDDQLLVDIDKLIEAYEAGLTRRIVEMPSNINSLIGYQASLTALEALLEGQEFTSNLSFTNIISADISEINNITEDPQENDREAEDYYFECSTTDIDGKVSKDNLDFFTTDSKGEFSFDALSDGKVYKKRFTNDFDLKFKYNLTEKIDEKLFGKDGKANLFGKDFNFGIEKCFDCFVTIDLSLATPAMEYTFDFSKQVNKIKDLLKQIDDDLNPTEMFKYICQFSIGFGENLICPSNLQAINLLLPGLFAKYSLDLASIRADWTVALGPILKTIIGGITSFLENIPRLNSTIVDCLINSLNSLVNYITAILMTAENSYNAVHNSVERIAQVVKRGIDALPELDSPEENLTEATEELFKKEIDLLLEKALAKSSENIQRTKEEKRTEALNLFVQFVKNNRNNQSLTLEEVKRLLVEWLTSNSEWLKYVIQSSESKTTKELSDLRATIKSKEDILKKYYDKYEKIWDESLETKKIQDGKKYFRVELYNESNVSSFTRATTKFTQEEKNEFLGKKMADYFNNNPLANEKAIASKYSEYEAEFLKLKNPEQHSGPNSILGYNPMYKQQDYNGWDWLLAKYGIDIENKYKESDYKLPGKGTFGTKTSKNIKEFVDTYLIKNLQAWKDLVTRTIGNIVLTLKNLEVFIGEYIETDIRILGNIQEILHLIRFTRLMYNLIENGLSDCDKIKENKEVFKSILESTHKDLLFDDETLLKEELDPEDYIIIKSKDGAYSSIIDLTDCSEATKHLAVNENNLDLIYEGIFNGLSK